MGERYLRNANPSLPPSFDSQESENEWAESMMSKYTIGELKKMFFDDKDDASVNTVMTSLAGYNFV